MNLSMNFQLKQLFQIESARHLPLLEKSHPCSRIHGHSFKLILTLEGPRNSLGWVIDYNDIKKAAAPVIGKLDHCLLNEVPGLENPTTENLCFWVYEKLKPLLPLLTKVSIQETPDTECSFPLE